MTTVEVLQKARELLSDPTRWTNGVAAADSDGRECAADSRSATRFCALGAIWRACNAQDLPSMRAGDELRRALNEPSISHWNDSPLRMHADVLAGFDRAIELARSRKSRKVVP